MRLFFSFIFLCAPFLIRAQYDFNACMRQGKTLYADAGYYEASVMFERAIFHASDGVEKAEATLHKVGCYKKLDRFAEGLKALDRVPLGMITDSLRYQVKYESALLAYLDHSYAIADLHLKQLNYFVKDKALKNRARFLRTLVLNGLQEFEAARDSLTALVRDLPVEPAGRDSLLAAIDLQYHKRNIPKLKSPERADLYSTFIPGAGQIYVGRVGEGVASFLLNAGSLGYMAFNVLVLQAYVTAFTTGSSLFVTFYFGGKRRATVLAVRRNEEVLHEFNQEIEALVLSLVR